jgi:hypothetical protein
MTKAANKQTNKQTKLINKGSKQTKQKQNKG